MHVQRIFLQILPFQNIIHTTIFTFLWILYFRMNLQGFSANHHNVVYLSAFLIDNLFNEEIIFICCPVSLLYMLEKMRLKVNPINNQKTC